MARERIGKYVVLQKLGEGGMGAVFLARHAQIGRLVAIKVLLPQHVHNADVLRRFFNEARATATLRHPGLVEIFDFGALDDGAAYLVMEFLEGETLARRIARAPVGPALAAEIGRQLGTAVEAAHARGIVHRDLKPENVILVGDPDLPHRVRVKVLDFGIAKLAEQSAENRTNCGLLLGTPAYMSPEQCRGAGGVDHRTDIYALGCVLFEMACRRLPFAFDNVADLIAAHVNNEPPDPLELSPAIPLALRDAILRCLAKEPGRRFPTAAALASALVSVTGSGPKTPKPASFREEETRVDPSIAARMAAQWDGDPPTKVGRRQRSNRTVGVSGENVRATHSTVADRYSLWRIRLAIVASIAATTAVFICLASAMAMTTARTRTTVAASTPGVASGKNAPPAAPHFVELRIDTIPAGAEVVSGTVVLGTTPLNIRSGAAEGTAEVEIRLDGYDRRRLRFATDRDEHYRFELRPSQNARRLVANRETAEGIRYPRLHGPLR